MRERTSNGTRLMGTNEFLHSRIVANAVAVSLSSWATLSEVKLWRKSACHFLGSRGWIHGGLAQRTTKNTPRVSAPRSEQRRAGKATDPFQGNCVRPLGGWVAGCRRKGRAWSATTHRRARVTGDSGPVGSALTNKYGNSRDLYGPGSYNSWNIPYPADMCATKTKEGFED